MIRNLATTLGFVALVLWCGTTRADERPVSFANKIVPIFTKHGCNGGGCHGKSGGQNGFRLSLLGFEPTEDYEHLVKEARGRRLFPAAPDRSLLLQKSVNAVPHGGGQRFDRDSAEYRLLARWIAQGMPYGTADEPTLARISVDPEQRLMGRNEEQQITVTAHYSDGSSEDVTALAQYDPNDKEMAEASPTGLVSTHDLAGNFAVMARYQGHVAVFQASVPLGATIDQLPSPRGRIDEAVFAKFRTLGLPPSPVCDNATFLRRVTIDIAGRLPTAEESQQFLGDQDQGKRDRLIDRLLDSSDYADNFAKKWSTILRNRRRQPSFQRGTYSFHAWIRESLFDNMPYDQFVREILAASGDIVEHPPIAWYREVNTTEEQVEDSAQLFLGQRIQCARCHHHPFEKWSQRDYFSYSAFFSRMRTKTGQDLRERRLTYQRGQASATHPKTREKLLPAGLGSPPLVIPAHRDPRQDLVDWMVDPANPYFAKALINRYWKHFLGRGIVEPEDDMRLTNPPSNPELLDALSRQFVASKFDLKDLVRQICRSTTYQLSSEPNEHNLNDKQNYSRFYPRRLSAEALLDAVDAATLSPTSFAGLPDGTRALQLPDTSVDSYFLTVFGRPESATACECERSQAANLSQSLHLFNSSEVLAKLSAATGRAAGFARDKNRTVEENVRELYLLVFSRYPHPDELQPVAAYIKGAENKQLAYEDTLWALINTKEFMFNH